MHRMRRKAGIVAEEDVRPPRFGFLDDGGKGVTEPALYGFRIALIGTLQRLLRCQPRFGKQTAEVTLKLTSNFRKTSSRTASRVHKAKTSY